MPSAITVWLLSWLCVAANGSTETSETRLVKDLMRNYGKFAKPTLNASDTIHLQFGVELVQIVSIMMPNQVLKTKLWARLKWKNELLAWNPSNYGGLKSIRLNAYDVWTPDIQLYQEFNPSEIRSRNDNGLMFKTQVMVENDGTTHWNSPATFTTSCELALADFPYDTQVCDMKFGPWNSDVSSLNMTADSLPLTTDKYIESSEWELLSVVKRRNTIKYACCDHPYADVTVTVKVRRKPLFYWFNLVIPYALLLLTLWVGYFVPAQSGERVSLSLVILLAFSIFVQASSTFLPRSSELPSLSILYFVVMIEVAVSALVTCFIVSVHYTSAWGTKALMPVWVEKNLLIKGEEILSNIGLLWKPTERFSFKEAARSSTVASVIESPRLGLDNCTMSINEKNLQRRSRSVDDSLRPNTENDDNEMMYKKTKGSLWQLSVTRSGNEDNSCQLPLRARNKRRFSELKLRGILSQLNIITDCWRDDISTWEISQRWCRLAVVLDRLFFIILSLFTLSTLLSFTIIRPAIAMA